jgi:hypothetical protein
MTLQAALAALAGVGYTAPSVPLFTRVARVERWFWGDRSTYAAKVAFGASVYTILLLAPAIQPFFIKYGTPDFRFNDRIVLIDSLLQA